MNSSSSKIIDDMTHFGRSLGSKSYSEIQASFSLSYEDVYVTTTEILGRGSQGLVKKCIRRLDNKEFAVKILYKNKMSKKDMKALQREIQILNKLKNLKENDKKYFIQLIDCYETEKIIYMVLNICNGGDLFDYICNMHKNHLHGDGRTINESYFKQLFYQLCRGVHVAHKNGIVHRDLKPENILFTDKTCTRINISDFGLSNINKSQMTTRCGSPNYVAPEILSSKKYGGKVDWWSCGVILFVCLSGQYPFHSSDEHALFGKVIGGEYDFNSKRWRNISPYAKDLISKLLKNDPKERLSFSQILKHPWMQSLNLVKRTRSKPRPSSTNTSKTNTPLCNTPVPVRKLKSWV